MKATTMKKRSIGLIAAGLVAATSPLVVSAGSASFAATPVCNGTVTGNTTTIGPTADVAACLSLLQPGDTLDLNSGDYNIGDTTKSITLTPGTVNSRITVTGPNHADLPHLFGTLRLNKADYWNVSWLHFTGQVSTGGVLPAVYVTGGDGWVLNSNEIDGAAATGALSNLQIDSSISSRPTNWQIINNCIHGAATATDPAKHGEYHNIYLSATAGDESTQQTDGAIIGRNILYNAPDGAQIKIITGDGTGSNASGVTVRYNTLYNSPFGIIAGGFGTSGNVIKGNLITDLNTTTGTSVIGVEVDDTNNGSNPPGTTIAHNYGAIIDTNGVLIKAEGLGKGGTPYHDGGDNTPASGQTNTPPWYDHAACGAFHPGSGGHSTGAVNYGVYSTVTY